LDHRFFGLTPSDRESILEQHYFLMRRINVSYTEIRSMPIIYRDWFIKRIIREHEEKSAAFNQAAQSAGSSLARSQTIARAFNR
jgi:hypothetical protein